MALSKFLKRLEIMEELRKKNMMSLRNILLFELFIAIFLMISMSSVKEIVQIFLGGTTECINPIQANVGFLFFIAKIFLFFVARKKRYMEFVR